MNLKCIPQQIATSGILSAKIIKQIKNGRHFKKRGTFLAATKIILQKHASMFFWISFLILTSLEKQIFKNKNKTCYNNVKTMFIWILLVKTKYSRRNMFILVRERKKKKKVEQICQCKLMLGWVVTIIFFPNLMIKCTTTTLLFKS